MQKIIRVGTGMMLLREGKILLGKRHIDSKPDDFKTRENNLVETWTMPGGKLELNETIIECIKRETLEETGISVNDAKIISINDPREESGYFLTIGFLSEDFEGEVKDMEPEKISSWQWFDLDNLPKPLFEPTRNILEKYFSRKIY